MANKLTRDELERHLLEVNKQLEQERIEHQKTIDQINENYSQLQRDRENEEYYQWVEKNGKFLSRFITDFIEENLQISYQNEDGYAHVGLYFGNVEISYDSDII